MPCDDYHSGKKVGTQSIVVKVYKIPNQITTCHVLFISSNKLASLMKY